MRTSIHPAKGDLIIARPYLGEIFFRNAVVLLLDTDSRGGLMGLSLNIPTDLTLNDLMPQWKGGKKIGLYCGGPCDTDRLFMLHTLGDIFEGSVEIIPGLYIGGKMEDIVEYIESGGETEGKMRFFLGYSGWMKDQLEGELRENTWAVSRGRGPEQLLTGSAISFWRRELAKLGQPYRSWLMMPTEAELN